MQSEAAAPLNRIGRAAGVSQATVSRVFASSSRIAGPMREKVLAAVVALGYRPNAIVRSLASQRSGMIGIVMGNMRNPFYPQVLELFSDRLRRTGRQVLLFTVRDGENVDDLLAMLKQPGMMDFKAMPQGTVRFAKHMHEVGLLKTMPKAWTDYFLPIAQDLDGN